MCAYIDPEKRSKISRSRRQDKLRNRILTSFTPLKAAENENRLYNSFSIHLFGNEEQAALLRLASVEYSNWTLQTLHGNGESCD